MSISYVRDPVQAFLQTDLVSVLRRQDSLLKYYSGFISPPLLSSFWKKANSFGNMEKSLNDEKYFK